MKISRNVRRVSCLAVALVAILTSYSQAVVLDYWRFEETSGQALDSAGANPGTLRGTSSRSTTVFGTPVPATGAANTQAMYFDGTNDSAVDMGGATSPPDPINPNPDRGLGDFTIEAWINRVGDNPDGYAVIAGKFPSGDHGDTGISIYGGVVADGKYEVALLSRLNGGTFNVARTGTGPGNTNFFLNLSTWYHVAGVRQGSQFRTYVDGVLHGSITIPATEDYTEPLQTFSIGGSLGGGTANWVGNFYGYIDEVRLSDTALTPDKFLNGPLDTGIDGDYNDNGQVDAGDYVLWRKGGALAHNPNPGNPTAQYNLWRANFGKPSPGSGSLFSAVPEPGSVLLVLLGGVGLLCSRRVTRLQK